MSTTGGPCCSAANPPDQETPMRRPSLRRHQPPGPAPEPASAETDEDRPEPQRPGAVLRYFLRLGTLGFGGPIAVVGYMQRDLVEQRGWIVQTGLPRRGGPRPDHARAARRPGRDVGRLPAQTRRPVGAAATALAFIAPSFLMVVHRRRRVRALLRAGHRAVAVLRHRPGRDGDHHHRRLQTGPPHRRPDRRAWAISAVVFAVTATTGREPILPHRRRRPADDPARRPARVARCAAASRPLTITSTGTTGACGG